MNAHLGDRYQAHSAGTSPTEVHPLAVLALAELGIDVSGQRSKHAQEFLGQEFNYVVTPCDQAKKSCPFFPEAREYIHAGFPEPASAEGPEKVRLEAFRRVRDAIREWLQATFG